MHICAIETAETSEETLVNHSNPNSKKKVCLVVERATVIIGNHTYTSRFAIEYVSYDIKLGMPCHMDTDAKVDYESRSDTIGTEKLYKSKNNQHVFESVITVSLKQFKGKEKN